MSNPRRIHIEAVAGSRADNPGDDREVYSSIREAFRSENTPLVYRVVGGYGHDPLATAWQRLRGVIFGPQARVLEDHAYTVANQLLATYRQAHDFPELNEITRRFLTQIVVRANSHNPRNLLFVVALATEERIKPSTGFMGQVGPRYEQRADDGRGPEAVQEILADIRAVHAIDIVPGFFHRLCEQPDLLRQVWSYVRPFADSIDFRRARARLLEDATELVRSDAGLREDWKEWESAVAGLAPHRQVSLRSDLQALCSLLPTAILELEHIASGLRGSSPSVSTR